MTPDELESLTLRVLSKVLNREISQKDLKSTLTSLGADSLDIVSLAFELETELDELVDINPEIFMQNMSLNESIDALYAELLAAKPQSSDT